MVDSYAKAALHHICTTSPKGREVVGGVGQPPAPPSRPGHSCGRWGSSALVITDSRVSFSDARIWCDGIAIRDPSSVSARARAWTCHPLCGRMIVTYVTSRNDYEMATGRYTPGWTWRNADLSWGFRGLLMFTLGRKRYFGKGDMIRARVTVATQASRAFPSDGPSVPFAPSSIRWAGTPTEHRGWRRVPNRSTEMGPWSRLRPLGVKPATFHPENNRRPATSPARTRQLTSWARTERTQP